MTVLDQNAKKSNPMSEKKRMLIEKGLVAMEKAVAENVEKPPVEPKEAPAKEEPSSPRLAYRPLLYLTFPIYGYGHSVPAWYPSLESALRKQGYLTYCPNKPVAAQFQAQDVAAFDILPLKVMASVCPILSLPEEILLPFSSMVGTIEKSDQGLDNSASVLTSLWFLARSALVIADLERSMIGAETAGELVYAKLLKIPSVGLLPGSGALSPWSQHLSTLLFTDRMLSNILPIIQGYAPLVT